MHDPNALLTTLSQSSAAIVAIIGGFLVSKLVAMSSEKEGLERQLKSAEQRLEHIKPAYEAAHEYRLNNSRNVFFGWVIDDLVEAGTDAVDYETLASKQIPRGSSLEEILPYTIEIHKRVKKAYEKISPMLAGSYSDSDLDLDDLKKRGLKIDEADESIYDDVFYKLKSQLPEKPPVMITGIQLPKMPNFSAGISLGAITPAGSQEIGARRLDDSIREEQNLKEQLVTVQGQIDRFTLDIAKLGNPVGVLPAVWTLALVSLFGIVLPIIVMSFNPTELTTPLEVVLIGAFILGLISVLGYILWYLEKINHQ